MDKRLRKIGNDWEIEYEAPGGTMFPQVTLRQRGRELVLPLGVARAVHRFLQEVFPPEAASSCIAQPMQVEEQTENCMQTLTGSYQQQARETFIAYIRTKSPTLRQVWDWLITMKIQIAQEHALPLLSEHQDWLMRPEGIAGSSVVTLVEYHLTQFLRVDLNQHWFTILTANVSRQETEGAAP